MVATVAGKKLGILLSTPNSHPSVDTVVGLCNAALQQGSDVYLYLIDEGVKNIRDPRLVTLAEKGMKLFVCAYGCQQHGIATADLDPHVSLCGLVVLSNMIEACDRFLAFT
jgi:sulfur relay (sulfurtransferase) complex TusBCD TusD component (DsrE family)